MIGFYKKNNNWRSSLGVLQPALPPSLTTT